MSVTEWRVMTAVLVAAVLSMFWGSFCILWAVFAGEPLLAMAGVMCWVFTVLAHRVCADICQIVREADGRTLTVPVACRCDACPWTGLRVVPDSPNWVEYAERAGCPTCGADVAAYRVDHHRNAGGRESFTL